MLQFPHCGDGSWRIDVATGEKRKLAYLAPPVVGSNNYVLDGEIEQFTVVGGSLLFVGADLNGREVWRTDGTPPAGPANDGYALQAAAGLAFFNGWQTDGSLAGTMPAVWPGVMDGIKGPSEVLGHIVYDDGESLLLGTPDDAQCAGTCIAGQCVAGDVELAGACDSHPDCVAGLSCRYGVCAVPIVAMCSANDDCVAACIDGFCSDFAALEEACDEDEDCSGGAVCPSGVCMEP